MNNNNPIFTKNIYCGRQGKAMLFEQTFKMDIIFRSLSN